MSVTAAVLTLWYPALTALSNFFLSSASYAEELEYLYAVSASKKISTVVAPVTCMADPLTETDPAVRVSQRVVISKLYRLTCITDDSSLGSECYTAVRLQRNGIRSPRASRRIGRNVLRPTKRDLRIQLPCLTRRNPKRQHTSRIARNVFPSVLLLSAYSRPHSRSDLTYN